MRTFCAIGLTAVLFAEPLMAVGPLAQSAAREVSRLVGQTPATPEPTGWKALRSLEPGQKVTVTTDQGLVSGAFVEAGVSTLTIKQDAMTTVLDAGEIQLVTRISRRGSAGAAATGVVGGLFFAPIVAIAVAGESRAGALAAWAAIIGIPIAGGYGAWYGTSRMTEEVIYRRSTIQPSRSKIVV